MNNDLEQFSEERLKKIIASRDFYSHEESVALARIALAAKQAKPVCYADQSDIERIKSGSTTRIGSYQTNVMSVAIYTTPQPANAEQDGWIKCSERMPDVGDVVLTADNCSVNVGESERSGANFRYFTSVITGRELSATHWMKLPAAPKPESE